MEPKLEPTLERNLGHLLQRAYEPVAASEALRARCLASVDQAATPRPRRVLGRILAAAALLAGASLAVLLGQSPGQGRLVFFGEGGLVLPTGARISGHVVRRIVSAAGDSLEMDADSVLQLQRDTDTGVEVLAGRIRCVAAARTMGHVTLRVLVAGSHLLPSRDGCEFEVLLIQDEAMKTKARNWLVGAGVLGVGVAAVAVYSGALQWIADERTLTVGAGESAVRAPDLPPALTASRSMPEPEPISAIRAGASDQEQLASQRTAVTGGAQPLSQEELRQMLFSSRRLDQVRAIELLLQAHTLEAAQTLLNGLLTSTDPVLLALLEEALLKSPLDVSPAVEAAFTTSNDPQKLEVLAHLLTQLVAKRPELESKVVGIFMGALKDLASNAPRADAASKELVALGIRATDQLGAYLADRETGPEGAGKAAWVLAQLSGEYRDVLRKKLRDGFEATLHALSDRGLSDADKDRIRKKTGSLAWASTLRSGTEHDVLAEVLVDSLTRTTDEAQAGTLGWGLANLKGLTDEGKLRATRALLSSLVGQANSGIAHSYVRAVSQLATGSSRSLEFVRLVEEALSSYGSNPQVTTQLRWLQTQLSPK